MANQRCQIARVRIGLGQFDFTPCRRCGESVGLRRIFDIIGERKLFLVYVPPSFILPSFSSSSILFQLRFLSPSVSVSVCSPVNDNLLVKPVSVVSGQVGRRAIRSCVGWVVCAW